MATTQPPDPQAPEDGQRFAAAMLDAGLSEAQVIARLVESGMDEHMATTVVRYVASTRAKAQPDVDKGAMLRGMLWFLGGTLVSAGAYLLAAPGQGCFVAWGAVIFGFIQFVRAWAGAGRRGASTGALYLLAALGVIGAAGVGYLFLSSRWTTYKHPGGDFTIGYPLLWKVEVEQSEEGEEISFVPRQGSRNQYELYVWAEDDTDTGEGTACDPLGALKAMVFDQANAVLKASAARCINSRLGARVAYTLESSETPLTVWAARAPVNGKSYVLMAIGVETTLEDLEPVHTQFVNSFRAGTAVASAGACAPSQVLQCPPQYDPFIDTDLGFSACYPSEWMVWCRYDAESEADKAVFTSPVSGGEKGYIIAWAILEMEGSDEWADADLLDLVFEQVPEGQHPLTGSPQVDQVNGLRAVRAAWEADAGNAGESREIVYAALFQGRGAMWYTEMAGPVERAADLAAIHEQFVASFSVLEGE
jgi:hypothetical protein